MHWRNQNEWALWHDREINGMVYSFNHLRSFDMPVVKKAKGGLAEFKVMVRVVFDCHVVTEKISLDEYDEQNLQYWKDTGGHCRKFNLSRYTCSLRLPTLISELTTGKVKCYVGKHIGKYNNYMVWESSGGQRRVHYQAYFDIYKPINSQPKETPLLILYVQSAYLLSCAI